MHRSFSPVACPSLPNERRVSRNVAAPLITRPDLGSNIASLARIVTRTYTRNEVRPGFSVVSRTWTLHQQTERGTTLSRKRDLYDAIRASEFHIACMYLVGGRARNRRSRLWCHKSGKYRPNSTFPLFPFSPSFFMTSPALLLCILLT